MGAPAFFAALFDVDACLHVAFEGLSVKRNDDNLARGVTVQANLTFGRIDSRAPKTRDVPAWPGRSAPSARLTMPP
ncbi:hypothetical protein JCM19992_34630 [Thermostilla marina]